MNSNNIRDKYNHYHRQLHFDGHFQVNRR